MGAVRAIWGQGGEGLGAPEGVKNLHVKLVLQILPLPFPHHVASTKYLTSLKPQLTPSIKWGSVT